MLRAIQRSFALSRPLEEKLSGTGKFFSYKNGFGVVETKLGDVLVFSNQIKFNPMKVKTSDGRQLAGLAANFADGELLELHYEKLEEARNNGLKLPFDKNSMVTGIDGGYVNGKPTHPTWNIIGEKVKGTGKFFNVKEGFGYIESEKYGDLISYQVNLGTMENEKFIPFFGQGEELEFDVHEHEGKRMAINVTGPGGAPLKGFKFIFEKAQN